MSEANGAASQAAEVQDVFRGEQVSMAEFSRFRQTGELPERFKPAEVADTASADVSEETTDSEVEQTGTAGESETPQEAQEPPAKKHQTAAQRIAKLQSTIDTLWEHEEPDTVKIAQLDATIERIKQNAGLKRKAEPAPAVQAPAKQETAKAPSPFEPVAFDQEKWLKDNPEAQYEDMIKAMVRHEALELRRVEKIQDANAQAQRDLAAKLSDAKARYEDAEEVIVPTTHAIAGDERIPAVIKQVLNDSEYLPDLMYVIGGELDKFVDLARSNPRAAMAKVFEYERAIREELTTPDAAKSGEKAPEPKKTSAPKPPTPVSGGSSRSFDVNDESLSPDEWNRKRTAELNKRGKR